MKLNLKLGVPTEALLKSPTTCFRLSKAATRISAALSFSEFYVNQAQASNSPFFTKRDIEHISAGFWQSSKSADDLAVLVDDQELRKDIQVYSKAAARLNSKIRGVLKTAKNDKSKPKPVTLHVSQVINSAKDLRKKALEIEKKVENLCTVDAPTAPAPVPAPTSISGRGRVMMAGSGGIIHKKKPMYPRYFVASMGRSRR
jgi:hypothetical protein